MCLFLQVRLFEVVEGRLEVCHVPVVLSLGQQPEMVDYFFVFIDVA